MKYKVGDKLRIKINISRYRVLKSIQERDSYLVVKSVRGGCSMRCADCSGNYYSFEGDECNGINGDGWCGVEEDFELYKWKAKKPKEFKLKNL